MEFLRDGQNSVLHSEQVRIPSFFMPVCPIQARGLPVSYIQNMERIKGWNHGQRLTVDGQNRHD